MGQLIFVVAKSGKGKSTSLRNLNPDETVIVNTDQKPLPFAKAKDLYNVDKGNYEKTSDVNKVISKLKEAHKNPKIKTFVVDTWSRVMTDYVMSPAFRSSNGFAKWGELSGSQYDLLNTINEKVRDDLNVYLFCHPETHYDDAGFEKLRIAVQGKQLEKFAPESFSSVVLYAEIKTAPGQENEHIFRTKNSGSDTCKTPMGMFEKEEIPNDLVIVNEAVNAYF